MTQDMGNKILTRKMENLTRGLSPCEVMRYAIVLVMMVVGTTGVWGQTDYSGTYYIASNGYNAANTTMNYYLCPTNKWYYYQSSYPFYLQHTDSPDNNNGMPFMTTYQCRNGSYTATNAVWLIEKKTGEDYYYIRHVSSGKYLTYNDAYFSNTGRVRVHLEDYSAEKDDYALFAIEYIAAKSSYDIISKYADVNNKYPDKGFARKYLNVNKGNQPSLEGTEADKTTPAYSGGIIGLWTGGSASDNNSKWYIEDVMSVPVITQQDDNTITITYPGSETVTLYYTTNGSKPDPANAGGGNPTQIYTDTPITMTTPVNTVKAIAVKAAGTGEAIDTYSRCVTLTTQRYIGSNYPYMFQNVECKDFYMIPGDVSGNNTTVNTSSLFRSTMAWTFTSAGYEDGVQYYYIKNGTNYLYHTSDGKVYMKTSSVFDVASDKTDYMFSIEQGYSDAEKNNPDGFHIVPKAKISDNTYCIYKGGWGNTTPPTLANSKADVMKGSNNARRPEQYHTRWNIITYAAPGNVLPTSLVTTDENSPALFKLENVGTAGQYMSSPATGNVGTVATGNKELAWYIKEASSDSERKYYYIVHKNTGKYLKFNKATTVNNNQINVLDFLDYDASASDRYQFVFAKSTIDGAYYIVPKGLEDVSKNNYYALYLDGTNPIKSNKERASDSYKWKLVPFCYNPKFEESEENITLTCSTEGTEIHYTDDGTEPNATSPNVVGLSTKWSSSDQVRIKAIGVIKEGGVVISTSEVVTLLNNPTVTLEGGTFTYQGTEHRPEVTLTIGSGETITSAPKDPATYQISYSNNINAGVNTASITITDLHADDNWYIWNVETTNFTIAKKMLTVTADDKTVEFGHPAPEYTITITGFENGETRNVLTTIPTATCSTYTTTSAVGSTHAIIPSGGVDENYDFTYVNGTLTVVAAFVTLTANSGTVTYNGTEQTVTGFTCSVDGLTFTGVSASGSGTNAGTYPVTFSGVTLNSTKDNTNQYIVTNIVDGTLTIDPAEATVTADDKSKTYGEADPAFTATVTGMVNSESTDLISYTLNRATGNNVGDYVITPTGDAAQGNYTVSYVPGTFTINPKALTITAQDQSITYGEEPTNAVAYSGFITGEDENTAGVLTGTLEYSYNSASDGSGTPYTTPIPQGTAYVIPGGLTATNYNITYNYGTLTVTAKSIGNGSSMASGFTLNFGDGGNIILLDGETTLTLTTDYTIGEVETTTSGKYSSKKVSGTGNYTGSFKIRNAIVNFQTDAERVEWSATFVAEPAGTDLADDTKGHKLPEGIRAFIITAIIDGEWAIPEPLNYIPEGVPVILVSDKESGGFEVNDASGHTAINGTQKDANMLIETTASTHFAARAIYLLSHNEFVHNMAGDLAAGKVYLDPNHTSPSPSRASSRLRIKWDAVTAIDGITESGTAESRNDAWYTLDGRKLNGKPTQKGMYITNGKKVVKN